MKLDREKLNQYRPEISSLITRELGEVPANGLIYFGVFKKSESGEDLQAFAAVKNYMGSWYLRCHVVKPEYRGLGLQRKLIRESLEYLAEKTDVARVSVLPDNFYSIRNIEAEGFMLEKRKKLKDGKTVLVYRLGLTSRKHK